MGLKSPKSIKVNGRRLSEILEAHAAFARGHGGAPADLRGADKQALVKELKSANVAGSTLRIPCGTKVPASSKDSSRSR